MKKTVILLNLFLSILILPSSLFAEIERPEIIYLQTYRYNDRKDEASLIYRTELLFNMFKNTLNMKLSPFTEGRWNLRKDYWERQEYGIEFGKDIFDWFYLGEGIHQTLRYNDSPAGELETRIKFHHKLISIFNKDLSGYILNEHTFSLKENDGIRNEVVIGIALPLSEHLSIDIDWRHIDWMHEPDTDNFEGSVKLSF